MTLEKSPATTNFNQKTSLTGFVITELQSFLVLVIGRLSYRPNTAKLLKRICSVSETLVSYLKFERLVLTGVNHNFRVRLPEHKQIFRNTEMVA